jgi:copper(I)-binding protein
MPLTRALPVIVVLGLTGAAGAHSSPEIVYRGHNVYVSQPWARATPPLAKNGAVYMTIVNSGDGTDRLIGATTPTAEATAFHMSVTESHVAKMRHVPTVDIPVNVLFELKPDGLHLMLLGLKAPLREGQVFPLTLEFEKGGPVKVDVVVEKPGSRGRGSTETEKENPHTRH